MAHKKPTLAIMEMAEQQIQIQGSFGRAGTIYWNSAEQYVRKNCTLATMNRLQNLKNTEADCYSDDNRIENFLQTLDKIII